MTFKAKYLSLIFLMTIFSFALNAQEGTVKISQDSDINKLLEYKKDVKTSAEIFKIQIDQSNDPDKAESIKSEFLEAFDEWPVEIVWNTPNYKIWVGNFASRLEADRAWAKIKKEYMKAIILKPKTDN